MNRIAMFTRWRHGKGPALWFRCCWHARPDVLRGASGLPRIPDDMKRLPFRAMTRNQRLKCECGGYHFPHRRAGGACAHSKTLVYHLARRQGLSDADARIELQLASAGVVTVGCPF